MRILFTGAFIDLKEKENNMRVRNEKNHAWINILPYFEFGASRNRLQWVEYGDSIAALTSSLSTSMFVMNLLTNWFIYF